MTTTSGWGGGSWGQTFWGGGVDTDLRLLAALAIRENVVRLVFNIAPVFTKLLDPHDASSKHRYSVVGVGGTIGLDEEPVREVLPLYATQELIELSLGRILDLTVDRAFTHYPAQYRVSVNNLFTGDGFSLDTDFTSVVFYGLRRLWVPASPENVSTTRDIANPQTYLATLDPLPNPQEALLLGSIPTDANGDYAFDDGITNLKKRVYRRLVTIPGSFAHAPDYGVGVPAYLKRLNQAGVRSKLRSEAVKQILLEPDVEACSVDITSDPSKPGLFRFDIRVKQKSQSNGVQFTFAFSVT
jgi:hypothetical protein